MRVTEISVELEREIIDYYLTGHSRDNCIEKFNISDRRFRTIMSKNNISKSPQQIQQTIEKTKQETFDNKKLNIVAFYQEGNSLCNTCKEFHIGYKRLIEILKEFGVKKHTGTSKKSIEKVLDKKKVVKPLRTEKEELEIINFYTIPESLKATKAQFHISSAKLYKILQKYSIEPHSRSTQYAIQHKKYIATCQEKYGRDNAFQSDICKNKARETKETKYGDRSYTNTEKAKETWLSEYGSNNSSKKKTLTEEEELKIITYYKEHTARDTANVFRMRLSRVNEILERHNIPTHARSITNISEKQISDMLAIYETHTDRDICKMLHITLPRWFVILKSNGIVPHTHSENRSLANFVNVNDAEVIEYYANHNMTDTTQHFSVGKKRIIGILERYGIALHTREQQQRIKSAQQSIGLQKFYQNNPEAAHRSHGRTRYIFHGISFDSSLELYLWIYAIDHKEHIVREPISLEYTVNGKKHYYFPDFLYQNMLVEVKGSHMMQDGKLCKVWTTDDEDKVQQKQKCMDENGVKIYTDTDLSFAIDYVTTAYGQQYIKQFRKRGKHSEY